MRCIWESNCPDELKHSCLQKQTSSELIMVVMSCHVPTRTQTKKNPKLYNTGVYSVTWPRTDLTTAPDKHHVSSVNRPGIQICPDTFGGELPGSAGTSPGTFLHRRNRHGYQRPAQKPATPDHQSTTNMNAEHTPQNKKYSFTTNTDQLHILYQIHFIINTQKSLIQSVTGNRKPVTSPFSHVYR